MEKNGGFFENLFKTKKGIFGLVCLIIVMAIVVFIFSRSLKPGDESSEESYNVRGLINGILSFFGFSNLNEHIVRKLAHFIEFASLGFFAYLSSYLLFDVEKSRYHFMISAPFSLLIASIDEFIQIFVDGRTGIITDVWLDFFGSLFGILIIFAIITLVLYINKKKITKNS